MQDLGLLYSLDETITIAQLKEGATSVIEDPFRIVNLQSWVEDQGIGCMIEGEPDFHFKLLSIKPKPRILYYVGNIELLHRQILGIVGPRKMTTYGESVLEALFREAPAYDIVTISGMAPGVDQLCHKLSRDKNIPTIAVLGGGLGRYLKRPERSIIEGIIQAGGLVISEYKLFAKPEIYTFPERNRLIAGLSDVLFLPEASQNSGSLITANFALELDKPVCVTPNSIFSPSSEGVHALVGKPNVTLVSDLKAFLKAFFFQNSSAPISATLPTLSAEEQVLFSLIASSPGVTLQELVAQSDKSLSDVIQLLTMLEINNIVYQETPGTYTTK